MSISMEPTELPSLPKKASYVGCIYSPKHESIFLIGSKGCQDCYKYDIQTSSYLKLSSYPRYFPTTHTILSLNDNYNELISLGGSQNHYMIYNVDANTWDMSLHSELMEQTCTCSIGVSAVRVNDCIHIINGCSGDAEDEKYAYQVIDMKTKQFVDTDKLPKLANRIYLKGLIHSKLRNSIIYFGGMQPGICTSFDLMYEHKLNINDKQWQLMDIKLPHPMSAFGYTKINIDNKEWVVIIGGGLMIKRQAKGYYNKMYVFDINNNKFYQLNETIYGELAGIASCYDSINGNIHIIGGGKGNELCEKHIMYNIGMKGNKNNQQISPIKYREMIWETLDEYNYYNLVIPFCVLQCIFDMIDDGLLVPMLVSKPYYNDEKKEDKGLIPVITIKDYVFKSMDKDNKKVICLDHEFNDVIFDLPCDNNELMNKMNKVVEQGKNTKHDVIVSVSKSKVDNKVIVVVQDVKIVEK
eukprot:6280_1